MRAPIPFGSHGISHGSTLKYWRNSRFSIILSGPNFNFTVSTTSLGGGAVLCVYTA
jgi:hypothetical protein